MLSFTCEGSTPTAARREPTGGSPGNKNSSQFGVIGRKVPPRLMLQCNPSSDPED